MMNYDNGKGDNSTKIRSHTHLKVLTVGDGDLTFSLALKRAYPQNLTVVASTLLSSREELIRTYSNASNTIDELIHVWKENVDFVSGLSEPLSPCVWPRAPSPGLRFTLH